MKKNNWVLQIAVPAIGLVLLLSLGAAAGTVYDKGALGKYERQGRYMALSRSVTDDATSGQTSKSLAPKNGTIIDKGALGTSLRQGRYVHRNLLPKEHMAHHHGNMAMNSSEYRVVSHIKHIHRFRK